jgi:hypothetical protein
VWGLLGEDGWVEAEEEEVEEEVVEPEEEG